jgi:hypothetical protein
MKINDNDPDMLFTGGAFEDDIDAATEEEIYYSRAERESCDRLDYANYVRESGDWRDPGEIRMGA